MKLIIVSGISGVGKSTLVRQFIKESEGEYELVRSMTTRAPRDADDYYTYISRLEFARLLEQGAFLETNLYQGSKEFYGTPKREIERIVAEGKTPVLEIDVHGKRQIECTMKQHGFVPISIFITAPAGLVYRRLLGRGESLGSITSRLKAAVEEIGAADEYTGVVENYDLVKSLNDMRNIVAGTGSSTRVNVGRYKDDLLGLIENIKAKGAKQID